MSRVKKLIYPHVDQILYELQKFRLCTLPVKSLGHFMKQSKGNYGNYVVTKQIIN